MATKQYFTAETFKFLKDLAANNNREWFQENKPRYEGHVKVPAMGFITEFGPLLGKISKHFVADARPVGGSLFRIYKDTRFSKDKRPYKTHTGIQFRHSRGKDVHAPGFYLHMEPRNVFAGIGMWHPDTAGLTKIRDAICEDPAAWKRVRKNKKFVEVYEMGGDSLKRAPKGYDPDHPLIEDLRRKDFVAFTKLSQKAVTSPDLPKELAAIFKAGTPLVKFLCEAVDLPF